WSEHCAYKHSKMLLRALPSRGASVVVGPGENAGAVDLGDGLLCVFKVESHNHPSAVEPYQGAATGVGGILRDVFAMGARPTAVLNALFFGPPDDPAVRRTITGVTGGISFYGNCVGIPDVAGHVSFEPCFADNPLVNAMCVGIARAEDLRTANKARPGSAVYLVGSDTGRDGIAGASLLASFELGSGSDAKLTSSGSSPGGSSTARALVKSPPIRFSRSSTVTRSWPRCRRVRSLTKRLNTTSAIWLGRMRPPRPGSPSCSRVPSRLRPPA